MTDDIELRMRKLANAAALRPADEKAIGQIHPWSQPDPARRDRRVAIRVTAASAAALTAILLVNVAAAYFAPRYQQAVAGTPGLGPASQRFLSAVGLKAGDVTVVNDSAASAGHTIDLVAAYADGLRTVLFLTIDGRGVTGNPKKFGLSPGDWSVDYNDMTLTDQFGHSYGGYGVGGPTDLQFEPLPWPASAVGARLTLHITGIWPMWKVAEAGPGTVIDTEALTVHGDWTLHATLIASPVHAITAPAPVQTAVAGYTFTSITATDTEMVLHWTVAGPVIEQMARDGAFAPLANTFGDPRFDQFLRPHAYSDTGAELQMQDFGYTWPKNGPAEGEMTVFIEGPGRYRIQVGTVASWWVVAP